MNANTTSKIRFAFLITAVIFSGCSRDSIFTTSWPIPYKLDQTTSITQVLGMALLDAGDSSKNILTWRDNLGGDAFLVNRNGGPICQMNDLTGVYSMTGLDINADGKDEIFANCHPSVDRSELRIYSSDGWPMLSKVEFKASDMPDSIAKKWDGGFTPRAAITGIIPNRSALLVQVASGFCGMPRGLMLLDPLNGEQIWHYWIASMPISVQLYDVTGDSIPEIILGTRANGNEVEWNGTNDTTCYLVVLDLQGNELWRQAFDGGFNEIKAYPYYNETTKETMIVALFTSANSDYGPSKWLRIRAKTGEITETKTLKEDNLMRNVWQVIEKKDGERTIILGTGKASATVYNWSFEPIGQVSDLSWPYLYFDVNRDGSKEIIGRNQLNQIVIYDENSRSLARTKESFDADVLVQPAFHDDPTNFWLCDGRTAKRLTLSPREDYYYDLYTSPPFFLSILFIVGLAGFIIWRYKTNYRNKVIFEELGRNRKWAHQIGQLAHDVRTPLNIMRLTVQNLEQELILKFGSIPEDLSDYFLTLKEQADRLRESASRMMDEIRVSPPDRKPVDIKSLVMKVIEQSPPLDNIKVSIKNVSRLPEIYADTQQLESAFENIIQNSFQAMPNGGELSIEFALKEGLRLSKASTVKISFSDTGEGIAPEHLSRVFERYFSTKSSGKGLGLALVKEYVEGHGGTVMAESQLSKGTTITVSLPVNSPL